MEEAFMAILLHLLHLQYSLDPCETYIVGDRCYPLLSFLMTLFPPKWILLAAREPIQQNADEREVSCCGGQLKARWKILQCLNVGVHHSPQTIVDCCVLHNLCLIARKPEPEICKGPDEAGSLARGLESERKFYYNGQILRQALAGDLHQSLSTKVM